MRSAKKLSQLQLFLLLTMPKHRKGKKKGNSSDNEEVIVSENTITELKGDLPILKKVCRRTSSEKSMILIEHIIV